MSTSEGVSFGVVIHGSLLCAITVAIISSNIFSIVVLQRVKTIINEASLFLMTSLCIADLLNGFICVLPMTLIIVFAEPDWNFHDFSPGLCKLQAFVVRTVQMIKVLLLLALNFDRYVAVTKALEYHSIVTAKVVHIGTTAMWLLALALSLINAVLLEWEVEADNVQFIDMCIFKIDVTHPFVWLNLVFLVIVPFLVTILIYVRLAALARHHAAQIAVLEQPNPDTNPAQQNQPHKASKTFRLMTLVFAISWAPFLIASILGSYIYTQTGTMWLLHTFLVISFCSGFINIIVYFLRNSTIRAASKSMLHRCLERCRHCLSSASTSVQKILPKSLRSTLRSTASIGVDQDISTGVQATQENQPSLAVISL